MGVGLGIKALKTVRSALRAGRYGFSAQEFQPISAALGAGRKIQRTTRTADSLTFLLDDASQIAIPTARRLGGGVVGRARLAYRRGLDAAPFSTLGGTAAGAAYLAEDVGGPIYEAMRRKVREDPVGDLVRAAVTQHGLNRAAGLREARIMEAQQRNQAALAAASPELYNQLVAGRKLPRGSVPLGARGSEALDSVTRLMAMGMFQQQQ